MALSAGAESALTFLIRADGSQAKSELSNTRAAIKKEIRAISEEFASQIPVIGRFTDAMSPRALGIAAVVAGTAGVVVGVAALGKAFADAGSRLNDLSIQSNLSVETLSGLELTIKQAGGSLEDLTGGMFRLQQTQAKARDGSDEAAAALKRVGVSAKATSEDALRQFVAGLREIEDVGARNAAGAAVMGKGYKNLSVLVNESTESIDDVIAAAREAGHVMSTAAALAADQMGDKIDELTHSLSAMGRQLISPAMPAFIGALNDVTGAASGTASGLHDIGQAIASIIDGGRIAAGVLAAIADNDIRRIPAMYAAIKKEQRGRVIDSLAGTGGAILGRSVTRPTSDADFGGAGKGGDAKDDRAAQIAEETRSIEREYQAQTAIIRRAQDLQLTSLKDATDRIIQAETDRYNALAENLNKRLALAKKESERIAILGELRDAEIEKEQRINAATDAKFKTQRAAVNAGFDALIKLGETRDAQAIASIEAQAELRAITYERAEEKIAAIQTEAFKRRLDVNRAQQKALQTLAGFEFDDAGNVIQDEVAQSRLDIQAFDKLTDEAIQIVQEWDGAIIESGRKREAARKKDIDNAREWARQLRELEYSTLTAALEVGQMKIEAMRRNYESRQAIAKAQADHDTEEERIRHERALKAIEDEKAITLSLATNAQERLRIQKEYNDLRAVEEERHKQREADIKKTKKTESGDAGIWEGMKKEMADLPTMTEAISASMVGMWRSVSGAVGETIKNYVLFGKVSGQAVRRAVAEALAATSAEMAVLSLKHLGLGFAAMTPWGAALYGSPANHFKASGYFAAAAAAAAIGGRVVAGSAFTEQASGAGGASGQGASGGRGSGAGNARSNDPFIISENRPRQAERQIARSEPATQKVDITVRMELPDGTLIGTKHVMVETIVEDWRNRGRIRKMLKAHEEDDVIV